MSGLMLDPIASSGGGGGGTVTSVSVVTANGVSGSVANPTTTPAITLVIADASATAAGRVSANDFSALQALQHAALGGL